MSSRHRKIAGALSTLLAAGCSQQAVLPVQNSTLTTSAQTVSKVYQPLAVGDYWTYICNNAFTIRDRVIKKVPVGGRTAFALSLQIPSSPTKSVTVVQLLSNDAHGNTWIYGYLKNGVVRKVKPAEIVAASPVQGKRYNYPGPSGHTISRLFKEFEYTNRTPLGVFWVAAYFESRATHNYGYSLGRGVMEQDHGPSYKYDCLIEKYVVHA